MKQAIRFWLMIWLSAVCCSCGDSGKAKETAEAFLDALRLNDEAKYVELYPEIKKISPMLSFNQYTIEEVVSKETCYEVVILGTREGDEKTSKKLKLYFSKDKHGEVVTDSQGFTAIEMSCKNFYLKSHGVYSESDTDLTIAKKIKEAETYWLEKYALVDVLLRELITCKGTKIERDID
ncbi:MAG: hypothetical protein EOM67_16560, partial [Spirochaetia bacterium]|nr:hypothetical protein [Spirochaetia bacterium]